MRRPRAEVDARLGDRLRRLRSYVPDLSGAELDRLAGMSRGYTALIESGKWRNLEGNTALSICEVLGARIEWLLSGEGDAPTRAAVRSAVDRARVSLG